MVKLKYFGMVADVANCTEENMDLMNTGLSDVLKSLEEKYDLGRYSLKVSVNQEIIDPSQGYIVKDNDEIALLPPFSGG